MSNVALAYFLLFCAATLMVRSGARSLTRGAQDVALDLNEDPPSACDAQYKRLNDRAQRREFAVRRLTHRAIVLVVPSALLGLRLLIGVPSFSGLVATALVGIALGYLIAEARKRRLIKADVRELEFFLPIVMERIVMAVQAGHDILASLKVILELDEAAAKQRTDSRDTCPHDAVTLLLQQVSDLAESGHGVEQSLHEIALSVDCPSLRHAFIHLAQAHKEGGELVLPLRELSDATQLYYQETIEEEIAKLPVKATLPLLCTFAGLIIFFLTAPMMQVIDITTKAMPR